MIQPYHQGFLDIPSAAKWCSVSPKTIVRWIKGGLAVYQAGPRQKVLIKPSDIEQFLTRQQRPKPNLDQLVDDVLQEMTKQE